MDDERPADLIGLTDRERVVVRQALLAIADDKFIQDWEFYTVISVTREEMRAESGRFPQSSAYAVVAALNNIGGYPHGEDEHLKRQYDITRDEALSVLQKLRS